MEDVEGLADLEELDLADCRALLAGSHLGRVGFSASSRLHVLPVNYDIDPEGAIVFRTTSSSVLIHVDGRPVVFEVDGFDERHHTGWSVCVHGSGREITRAAAPEVPRPPRRPGATSTPGQRERWFTVTPDAITGRRLALRPPETSFGWVAGVVG